MSAALSCMYKSYFLLLCACILFVTFKSCFVIAWKDNTEKSCFTLNNYFNMQVINTEAGIRVIHVAAVPG